MSLEWNFIGASVVNWHTSFKFYTQVLGLAYELNPKHGDWALLGGGWDAFYAESLGTTFELFDAGKPASTDRTWGNSQGVRPAIHVRDLETSVAYLKARGIIFTSEIETCGWGRLIEFIAPESVRLALLEVSDRVVTTDWQRPIMASVEIKAHNFTEQVEFYRDAMELEVAAEYGTGIVLRHNESIGNAKPQIILEKSDTPQPAVVDKLHTVRDRPFFLSFMTPDIQVVGTILHEKNVTIIKPIISHSDWGGTDMHIMDADGNTIQIVQYH